METKCTYPDCECAIAIDATGPLPETVCPKYEPILAVGSRVRARLGGERGIIEEVGSRYLIRYDRSHEAHWLIEDDLEQLPEETT